MLKNRKLKKFIKNPKMFFLDMKLLKSFRAASSTQTFYQKNMTIKPIIKEKPKNKQSDFLLLRTFKNTLERDHKFFWVEYEKHNLMTQTNFSSRDNNDSHQLFLIFPSGDFLWDLAIVDEFSQHKITVLFFPYWELFDRSLTTEDIYCQISKNHKESIFLADKALNYLSNYCFEAVVLSDLSSPFTELVQKRFSRSLQTFVFPYCLDSEKTLDVKFCLRSKHAKLIHFIGQKISNFDEHHLIQIDLKKSGAANLNFDYFKAQNLSLEKDKLVTIILPILGSKSEDLLQRLEDFLDENCVELNFNNRVLIVSSNKVSSSVKGLLDKYLINFYKKKVVFREDVANSLKHIIRSSDAVFAFNGLESLWLHSVEENLMLGNDLSDLKTVPYEYPKGIDFVKRLKGEGERFEMMVVPDDTNNKSITEGRQKYLTKLLHTNEKKYGLEIDVTSLFKADYLIQWGAEPNESKSRSELYATALGLPRVYLEDGFIRSVGLWTDPNEPTLSLIVDTNGAYYDATQPTLLENLLNGGFELNVSQVQRARSIINTIVSNKISKYNYAPDIEIPINPKYKKRILIVDQKAGDMSLKYGLADSETFTQMLNHAYEQDDVEIFIKQHPCAITGGEEQAHYTHKKLGDIAEMENVHLISFDINPYSLINAVDEVYVVSSGMGFEALMAGKSVTCFGVPFYSGWGITNDFRKIDRRTSQRSLEDVFYIFYLLLSVYVSPVSEERCELEELIEYMITEINKVEKV